MTRSEGWRLLASVVLLMGLAWTYAVDAGVEWLPKTPWYDPGTRQVVELDVPPPTTGEVMVEAEERRQATNRETLPPTTAETRDECMEPSIGPPGGGRDGTAARCVLVPGDHPAQGHCAPAIVLGIYDWETCAWGTSDDPEMSRSEMEALVSEVWAETLAPGKPHNPPTLEEGNCGADVLGCYLGHTHTIRLTTGFTLRTILHELAHALISENEAVAACRDDWTHRQPLCSHGDWYRCAADTLYVRYAGIETAGVCGSRPDLDPGDWALVGQAEGVSGVMHAAAAVPADEGEYSLLVACLTDLTTDLSPILAVLLRSPLSVPSGQESVRVTYRLSGGQPTSSEWRRVDQTLGPVKEIQAFVDMLQSGGTLFMSVPFVSGDEEISFDLGDSPALTIVADVCGRAAWRWAVERVGGDSAPE